MDMKQLIAELGLINFLKDFQTDVINTIESGFDVDKLLPLVVTLEVLIVQLVAYSSQTATPQ